MNEVMKPNHSSGTLSLLRTPPEQSSIGPEADDVREAYEPPHRGQLCDGRYKREDDSAPRTKALVLVGPLRP